MYDDDLKPIIQKIPENHHFDTPILYWILVITVVLYTLTYTIAGGVATLVETGVLVFPEPVWNTGYKRSGISAGYFSSGFFLWVCLFQVISDEVLTGREGLGNYILIGGAFVVVPRFPDITETVSVTFSQESTWAIFNSVRSVFTIIFFLIFLILWVTHRLTGYPLIRKPDEYLFPRHFICPFVIAYFMQYFLYLLTK